MDYSPGDGAGCVEHPHESGSTPQRPTLRVPDEVAPDLDSGNLQPRTQHCSVCEVEQETNNKKVTFAGISVI